MLSCKWQGAELGGLKSSDVRRPRRALGPRPHSCLRLFGESEAVAPPLDPPPGRRPVGGPRTDRRPRTNQWHSDANGPRARGDGAPGGGPAGGVNRAVKAHVPGRRGSGLAAAPWLDRRPPRAEGSEGRRRRARAPGVRAGEGTVPDVRPRRRRPGRRATTAAPEDTDGPLAPAEPARPVARVPPARPTVPAAPPLGVRPTVNALMAAKQARPPRRNRARKPPVGHEQGYR